MMLRRASFGLVAALLTTAAPSLAAPICRVSGETPLIFDALYDVARPDYGRASFTVTCTTTQTTSISLLYSHRMIGDRPSSDLPYDLFADSDHASVWGSGGDGAPVSETFAAGRPTIVYIYARIAPHVQAPAGRFTDDVQIVTMP